jgi:hypothetical protein
MRAFVAALMRGAAGPLPAPPADLVRLNHLGPLAYRRGMSEHRAEYAASAIMAERRAAMLAEVTGALRARGVRAALIKGIAYAGDLYPDPAERPMHDIDLVVPRVEFPEAMRCMAALGMARVGRLQRRSRYYHAIELARGDMRIELHRSIIQHYRTSMRVGDIWRRAGFDPAMGAWRFDPLDDLIICLLHIARSELAVPVLNYVDVARLEDRLEPAALDRMRQRAIDYRIGRAVAAVLAMAAIFRSGQPGRLSTPGARIILPASDEIILGARPGRLRQIGQKLILTEGPREILGLGFGYGRALIDGARRSR